MTGVLDGDATTVLVLAVGLWLTNAPLLRQLADERPAGSVDAGAEGEREDEKGGDEGLERVRGDVGAYH